MYDYDSSFHNPPAPVISIELSKPDNKNHVQGGRALLDSGSDVTCIPEDYIQELMLDQMRDIFLLGYDEQDLREATTYSANIKLDEFDDLVEVTAIPEGNEIIIGRNLLNRLKIFLDGINQQFEIDAS